MLQDIVVDANVFMHADNDCEVRQASCRLMISLLQDSQTFLCLDEGFDLSESKNRSHIGGEYLRHLRAGMVGYDLVAHLAKTSRLKLLSRKVPSSVAKRIRQQIGKGPDRTYVLVALNSIEKIFTSHDLGDIPQTVRDRLRDSIEVQVVTAVEITPLLHD